MRKIVKGRVNSSTTKNFAINFKQNKLNQFPNEFILKFDADAENFEVNFSKESKKYPNIYVIDKQGEPREYQFKNPGVKEIELYFIFKTTIF